MPEVVIEIYNLQKLSRIINNLSEAEEEVVKPIVQNGVGKMEETAKGICPVDTGTLQKSIHIEGEYPYMTLVADAVNKYGDGYARFVEEGTWKQEGQHYMHYAVSAEMANLIPILRVNLRNFING
jgi:hypothetical protein